jgi:hypothetical protein
VTRQSDLFENTALLAWLPGETLFSLVSRHHYFWGYRLASQTCQRFFGHSRSGSQHDLPSRLSEFAARTGGHYGDSGEVARQRTILSGSAKCSDLPPRTAKCKKLMLAHRKNCEFESKKPLESAGICI